MKNQESPTLTLAKTLIACPSVTPEDAGCQTLIAKRLEKIGFKILNLPFGDVQNLWAIRGEAKPLLVFAGHTDVVPPGDLSQWATDPFTPFIKNDLLYGRGSADMKGGLAAMITAVERFVLSHPNHKGSLAFLITSDEEGPAHHGTIEVIRHLQAQDVHLDYCVIGEPSSHDRLGDVIKNGRRGSLTGNLKILGKQGHVAYPQLALNPIHKVLEALNILVKTTWDTGNPYFPATSFQISNIKSGTGAGNVIPGFLECQFNFRFGTETTPEQLQVTVENLLKSQDCIFELNWQLSGSPFLTPSGKLISVCQAVVEEITLVKPRLSTDGGTSDGRFIAPTGTEVIEIGPCNQTIHSANECVNIKDLDKLSKIYEKIIERLL